MSPEDGVGCRNSYTVVIYSAYFYREDLKLGICLAIRTACLQNLMGKDCVVEMELRSDRED